LTAGAQALLGLGVVRAFVSRGRRTVGVVGHEQGDPVLLLGAEHLDASSEHAFGPAEAFTPEQFAELYDVNVLSTQRVNRAALPHMRRQGQGLLEESGTQRRPCRFESSACLIQPVR
jgi:NAD(P)-dependent dehydrogenase (short-subunit alcohol dehydrogenase family)